MEIATIFKIFQINAAIIVILFLAFCIRMRYKWGSQSFWDDFGIIVYATGNIAIIWYMFLAAVLFNI